MVRGAMPFNPPEPRRVVAAVALAVAGTALWLSSLPEAGPAHQDQPLTARSIAAADALAASAPAFEPSAPVRRDEVEPTCARTVRAPPRPEAEPEARRVAGRFADAVTTLDAVLFGRALTPAEARALDRELERRRQELRNTRSIHEGHARSSLDISP